MEATMRMTRTFLACCAAAALLVAVGASSAAQSQGFSISEASPSGTVPHENLEGGIWVLFNKPVVSLKSLDKPATSSKILTIVPKADGVYRWYGSRLLAFEPTAPLAPATEYTFSVDRGMKSLEGETLAGDTRFSFRTEPLALVSVTPEGGDVAPEASREIVVTFNFPVDLKTITPFIKLQAGAADVPFKASRTVITDRMQLGPYENADRLVSLKPTKDLPWDTDVKVRLLTGAKPLPNTYGTAQELAMGFHTLAPLRLAEQEVTAWGQAPTAVLRFNHPVQKETVAPSLRLNLPGYDLEQHLEVSGSWVLLHELPVDFESAFSIQVLGTLADTYGQKLGADQTVNLEVGPANSYVSFRGTGQKLLESQFPPVVAVEMQNVDSARFVAGRIASPFGKLPTSPSTTIDVSSFPRNARHFELFDLSAWMNEAGKGAAFLSWVIQGRFWGSEDPQEVQEDLVVQVTDIGASIHMGYNSLVVLANSLATGAPIADASVTLRKDARTLATGRTDAAGIASLALAPGLLLKSFRGDEEKAELEIVKGQDRLVLRPTEMPSWTWNSTEPFSAEAARPLTYLWSDRGIYRPGETVSFAGIDRNLALGRLVATPGKFRVDLVNGSEDADAAASFTGSSAASGSFSGSLQFPTDAEPGDWFLVFHRLAGKETTRTGSAYVQVANFRRVAFQVDLSLPEARSYMGDALDATFSGQYLAGGAVSKGTYSWFWTRRETWYQPPGDALADYSFGEVQKGWAEDLGSDSGPLAADGVTVASQKLGDGEPGRVYAYEVVATVQDIDRQAISKRDSRLVFTSQQLLGAKITADTRSQESLYFVKKGQQFVLRVVSVDPEGAPLTSGDVQGRLIREEWTAVRERTVGDMVDTRYERQDVVERTFTARPGQASGVQLVTQKAGSYSVELTGKDAKGRESFTRVSFYSTGADEIYWERSDERRIELVPDKKLYAPGDTARLLVKSPLAKGTYLVIVEREGVLERRILDLAGGAPTIEVPIREEHVPVVYVYVATSTERTVAPAAGPDLPDFGKPRGYSGLVELPVQTQSRTITLSVTSAKPSWLPGTEATLTVKASWNGKPLEGAEIALVAADRGVLDLIDYRVPSPIAFFYSQGNFPDRVAHYDSRDLLLDPVTWKGNDLPGGDEKGEEAPGAGVGVSVRKDFNPTALFRTGLVTGRDGTVSIKFKLPDQLTRYRATAVAVKEERFGIGEGELLVQNPINVRTALPRRMRVGDTATAGVVLTNLDGKPHQVSIGLSARGVEVQGQAKKSVNLKPGETAEVAFELAARAAGEAQLSFSVDSDALRERLEDKLPIGAEHVRESFTIVGKTTDTAKEGLTVPSFLGVPDEGLSLTLDSTIASALAGAVKFLEIYPFDCLEQVTSKLFARVLFPELVGAGRPDLETLTRFANPDGGFSYWDDPFARRSNYYVSLRVAHLLAAAKAKNIAAPAGIDTPALLAYLAKGWENQGTWLQSYGLYVLSTWGRKERGMADSLAKQGDKIGVFGYGFLGLAYEAMGDQKSAQAVLTRLKNFVRPGTRTVTLVGTVEDWMWYGGDIQAKALLLMLYARLQPDSQLVLGLANDLLASSGKGYWGNTSNAGWVLQAFSELIARGGEANANFTARVKLGATEIASRGFRGLSKSPYTKQITAKDLVAAAAKELGTSSPAGRLLPLSFAVDGKGTLYYTAVLGYALSAAEVEPRDEGIGIVAEIIDDRGRSVTGTDLVLGKVYRMRLVFYSSKDRTFLALRAPIPSGAEPIDGSLATSQVVQPPPAQASEEGDSGYAEDSWYPGYTTRIYDNEVRFFFDELSRGKHEVSFLFRTTTPGTFPTPPIQAELMYQPEVFGRTAGAVYRIGGGAAK
jgi:uncharacterized protein YfaS (alpha-2-macroglobulin family)